MADNGFNISHDLIRECRLNMPFLSKVGGHLSKSNVTKGRNITHVERAIRHIKQYRILTSVIPLNIYPFVDLFVVLYFILDKNIRC